MVVEKKQKQKQKKTNLFIYYDKVITKNNIKVKNNIKF